MTSRSTVPTVRVSLALSLSATPRRAEMRNTPGGRGPLTENTKIPLYPPVTPFLPLPEPVQQPCSATACSWQQLCLLGTAWQPQYLSDNQTNTQKLTHEPEPRFKMKMKALKLLGEEKPAAIDDTKFSDTLVDVPLPDSEPKTESKTKMKCLRKRSGSTNPWISTHRESKSWAKCSGKRTRSTSHSFSTFPASQTLRTCLKQTHCPTPTSC